MKQLKSKKGFTLTELIVVIAIIGILAAVLIPTITGYIERAKNADDIVTVSELNKILVNSKNLMEPADYETAISTAENIRTLMAEHDFNNFATKNTDNVIMFNQTEEKFEIVSADDFEAVGITLASYVFHKAYAFDSNITVRDNPSSLEEFIEGYILVSTSGNKLSEAVYALHNLDTSTDLAELLDKIEDTSIRTSIVVALTSSVFVPESGTPITISQNGENLSFDATPNLSEKNKVVFNESVTSIDLSTLTSLGSDNDSYASIIIPNKVETVTYSDTTETFVKPVYISGHVNAIPAVVVAIVENDSNAEITQNTETAKSVAGGENVVWASFNDTKTVINFFELKAAMNAAQSGAKVIIGKDFLVTSDITVPTGVTLLVPLDANDLDGNEDGTLTVAARRIATSDMMYRNLTIAKDVVLSIQGKLIVGGTISYPQSAVYYQGHTSGAYGQITNNGEIVVNDGGVMDIWGFVKGTGEMTSDDGSTVYVPFIVTDYAGGSNSASLYFDGQSPFLRYSVMNIQLDKGYKVNYGSLLYGHCNLYASSAFNKTDAILIGNKMDTNTTGLINLVNDSCAIITYDGTRSVKEGAGTSTNNLSDDIGVTTVQLIGGASTSSMRLMSIASTEDVIFPIPFNFNFILSDGDFSMFNQYVIMPGSSMIVEEDARLIIEADSAFYVLDGLKQDSGGMSGKLYPTSAVLLENGFSQSGDFIVNGQLIIGDNAKFGGLVQTTNAGAKISVSSTSIVTLDDYTVQIGSTAAYTANTSLYQLSGKIYDSSNNAVVNMASGVTYEATSATTTFNITSYDVKYLTKTGASASDYDETVNSLYYNYTIESIAIVKTAQGAWGQPATEIAAQVDSYSSEYNDLTTSQYALIVEGINKYETLSAAVKTGVTTVYNTLIEMVSASFEQNYNNVFALNTSDTLTASNRSNIELALNEYDSLSNTIKTELSASYTKLCALAARAFECIYATTLSLDENGTLNTTLRSDIETALDRYDGLRTEIQALLGTQYAKLCALDARAFACVYTDILNIYANNSNTYPVDATGQYRMSVNEALDDYNELRSDVSTLLSAEKALLDSVRYEYSKVIALTVGDVTTSYVTVADAVAALTTSATTIKLLDDVSYALTIAAGYTVTIDLNGHTWSGPAGSSIKTIYNNKGTVSIVNTSENKAKIISSDISCYGYYANGGTTPLIENVTFEAYWNYGSIYINGGTTGKIKDCKLVSTYYAYSGLFYIASSTSYPNATVDEINNVEICYVAGSSDVLGLYLYANRSSITINKIINCNFDTKFAALYARTSSNASYAANITINSIENSTFISNSTSSLEQASTVTLLSLLGATTYLASDIVIGNISDTTISGPKNAIYINALASSAKGNVTITNVENCDITNTTSTVTDDITKVAIYNKCGVISSLNANVKSTSSYAITNDGNSNAGYGQVKIAGGNYLGHTSAFYNLGIIDYATGKALSETALTSGDYAGYYPVVSGFIVSFYDSDKTTLLDKVAVEVGETVSYQKSLPVTIGKEFSCWKNVADDSTVDISALNSDTSVYAAYVDAMHVTLTSNSETYVSIATALAAAANGDTIKLVGDLVEGSITVASGKSVTIDLQGHDITFVGATTACITNQGTLSIIDSVGGGKIINNCAAIKAIYNNGGTITLISGITVESTSYAVWNYHATANSTITRIENSEFSSKETSAYALYSMGTIMSDNSGYYPQTIGIVDNCTFRTMGTSAYAFNSVLTNVTTISNCTFISSLSYGASITGSSKYVSGSGYKYFYSTLGTIANCNINSSTTNTSQYGLRISQMYVTDILDCDITATSYALYTYSATYNSIVGGNYTSSGYTAVAINASVTVSDRISDLTVTAPLTAMAFDIGSSCTIQEVSNCMITGGSGFAVDAYGSETANLALLKDCEISGLGEGGNGIIVRGATLGVIDNCMVKGTNNAIYVYGADDYNDYTGTISEIKSGTFVSYAYQGIYSEGIITLISGGIFAGNNYGLSNYGTIGSITGGSFGGRHYGTMYNYSGVTLGNTPVVYEEIKLYSIGTLPNTNLVTFYDDNHSTILNSGNYVVGSPSSYTLATRIVADQAYIFVGWTNSEGELLDLSNITESVNAYPKWIVKDVYQVNFYNLKNEVIATESVISGESVNYSGGAIIDYDATNVYLLDKWVTALDGTVEADLTSITSDLNVYASCTTEALNGGIYLYSTGDYAWSETVITGHNGAWVSGNYNTDESESVLTMFIPKGTSMVTFNYKAQTEEGWDFYYLTLDDENLAVEGSALANSENGGVFIGNGDYSDQYYCLSGGDGETWSMLSIDITDSSVDHYITVVYAKDAGYGEGADSVWIADIQIIK